MNDTTSAVRYVELRPIILSVPLSPRCAIKYPERVILDFGESSLDVGALCFLRRGKRPSGRKKGMPLRSTPVDRSSLLHARIPIVRKLIRFLSDRQTEDGYRLNSVLGQFYNLRIFLDWCDLNEHVNALSGGPESYAAFKAFVDFLQKSIHNNSSRRFTAWQTQLYVEKMLRDFLNIHDLFRNVNRIYQPAGDRTRTEPPNETELAKSAALCEGLFDGFTKLVVDELPFPYKLILPKYLGWKDYWLWIFPDVQWCLAKTMSGERKITRRKNRNYDYIAGKIIDLDEAITIYKRPSIARQEIKRTSEFLMQANRDNRHFFRLMLAIKAHNSFASLFIAQTGITMQVARDIPWNNDDQYTVSNVQQGFRELKWRAGGKPSHAVIRSQFLPLFKKYLSLRRYLLGTQTFPYLFLSLGSNYADSPRKMNGGIFGNLLPSLRRIDPSITSIASRALRSAKQDFHVTRDDPSVAATIMGHTESTANEYYSNGTKTSHYDQMTTFFAKVKQAAIRRIVLLRRSASNNYRASEVGGCINYGSPASLDQVAPITPDCAKPEGCLFCSQCRVHADEIDIRKLASCAYVVERIINLPSAEAYFRPVQDRIREILDEVCSRGREAMVKRILHEVNAEGRLSPYWEEKLALLEELEIAQ
ncbi:hypothetical protein [Paraburkholderia sp. RL17-381-BIF-C]|uniref:hypothetical protein n=1 Tax=Paraburkholderia sp. RL17-381-BIF-C TaxID=3031635 RepID=UPI0038B6B322